jgi:hypothetical protein
LPARLVQTSPQFRTTAPKISAKAAKNGVVIPDLFPLGIDGNGFVTVFGEDRERILVVPIQAPVTGLQEDLFDMRPGEGAPVRAARLAETMHHAAMVIRTTPHSCAYLMR